ncbi:MAG: DUF4416 family protein [Thermodesulfobacteriota bacterium]
MARPHTPGPVKLFSSLFSSEGEVMGSVLRRLEERFGAIDYLSGKLSFNHTEYYQDEFGGGLFRKMVSFEQLIQPDLLPSVKLFTNALEDEYAGKEGRRRVNIDPGYLALDKVVLASCKNFSHRLYLGEGVFGEAILLYKRGAGFLPLDWTYPDYRSDTMRSILEEIRMRYGKQVELDDAHD